MENFNLIFNREKLKNNIINYLNNLQNKVCKNYVIYVYGNNGIGKTTFITNILEEANYDTIYYNSLTCRNKAFMENLSSGEVSNNNVYELFNNRIKSQAILLDDIDSMTMVDKLGVSSLIKLLREVKKKKKKIRTPIILINNKTDDKKTRDLMNLCECFYIPDPTVDQIVNYLSPVIHEKSIIDDIIDCSGCDLRKINNIKNIYVKNKKDVNLFLVSNEINNIDITKQVINDELNLLRFNDIISDGDRTSVALLFHENIIDILKPSMIELYIKILDNICYGDYLDRVTFQKQLWIFNEMSSIIKVYTNNILIKKNNLPNVSDIRFTKVLTKYSTEYSNLIFINNICFCLGIDKLRMYEYFSNREITNELLTYLDAYDINKQAVNRMYRFIDNIIPEDI